MQDQKYTRSLHQVNKLQHKAEDKIQRILSMQHHLTNALLLPQVFEAMQCHHVHIVFSKTMAAVSGIGFRYSPLAMQNLLDNCPVALLTVIEQELELSCEAVSKLAVHMKTHHNDWPTNHHFC